MQTIYFGSKFLSASTKMNSTQTRCETDKTEFILQRCNTICILFMEIASEKVKFGHLYYKYKYIYDNLYKEVYSWMPGFKLTVK